MGVKSLSQIRGAVLGAIVFVLGLLYCYVVHFSLFIPFLLLIYALHLISFRRADRKRLIHVALLLSLTALMASIMSSYGTYSPYYIPVAAVPMLAMLLFSELPLAFSISLITSALVGLIAGTGVEHLLILFSGGLTAAYVVRDARTRTTLLVAGLAVGIVQVAGYLLFRPEINAETWEIGIKPLFFNGLISAMVVIATLKIFEYLFGELTNFSLLELSDALNQPILKRMAFEAPGTYHHSLVLSNIAGAAADAIGANQLLVRVGAYYHDIGKLEKPEYFTENQIMANNKHDDLEPNMSRLVILNHVKEGAELARKHGLNQKIVDFIEQHHGTSLIHFFYQKALENDGMDVVDEADYRYPGPKPQTKEVAIVMLADAVEGATRAMDEHTPSKIEDVVRKVVNNKFIDGQLDECNLTLKEIEVICAAFARVLSAMYHVRIKYPAAQKKSNAH